MLTRRCIFSVSGRALIRSERVLFVSGVGVAFVASLSFKTKFFRHHHMPLESCMVVVFAFGSYMLADSFGLSGIVAILFCGLVRALLNCASAPSGGTALSALLDGTCPANQLQAAKQCRHPLLQAAVQQSLRTAAGRASARASAIAAQSAHGRKPAQPTRYPAATTLCPSCRGLRDNECTYEWQNSCNSLVCNTTGELALRAAQHLAQRARPHGGVLQGPVGAGGDLRLHLHRHQHQHRDRRLASLAHLDRAGKCLSHIGLLSSINSVDSQSRPWCTVNPEPDLGTDAHLDTDPGLVLRPSPTASTASIPDRRVCFWG